MSLKIQKNRKNPWKIIRKKEIYRNQWMGVLEYDVIRPDGIKGIYSYLDCHPAVGIIPVDKENNTWLVGQYRFPLKTFTWEIPSGMGDRGESPEKTALRELREETGILAGKIDNLGSFQTSNALTNEIATIFLGRELRLGKRELDATEEIDIQKIPLSEIPGLIEDGQIVDAMSLLGLTWAFRFLGMRGPIH